MKNKISIIVCFLLLSTVMQVSVSGTRLHLSEDGIENIGSNSPPNKPIIIIPDTIVIRRPYKIKVDISDPDGDDIYLRFDASFFPVLPDYWLGPIESPFQYDSWVTYIGPVGSYEIGVQAKDTHEAESEWTYVQFNVTKSRSSHEKLFGIFENYLELFPILKQIFFRVLH